jgi:hypothetical protein
MPGSPLPDFFEHAFATARALDLLDHACAIADDELAALAAARVRMTLAALERASPTADVSPTEASTLLHQLRERAAVALDRAPVPLRGVAAAMRLLARFGPRR